MYMYMHMHISTSIYLPYFCFSFKSLIEHTLASEIKSSGPKTSSCCQPAVYIFLSSRGVVLVFGLWSLGRSASLVYTLHPNPPREEFPQNSSVSNPPTYPNPNPNPNPNPQNSRESNPPTFPSLDPGPYPYPYQSPAPGPNVDVVGTSCHACLASTSNTCEPNPRTVSILLDNRPRKFTSATISFRSKRVDRSVGDDDDGEDESSALSSALSSSSEEEEEDKLS